MNQPFSLFFFFFRIGQGAVVTLLEAEEEAATGLPFVIYLTSAVRLHKNFRVTKHQATAAFSKNFLCRKLRLSSVLGSQDSGVSTLFIVVLLPDCAQPIV